MSLYHPENNEEFRLRDDLLQNSLRPEPLSFPIASEYPIVLSPEGRLFSYCRNFNKQICSHANLWPRALFNGKDRKLCDVGLIGNVATDPRWRGLGHMRDLMNDLENLAHTQHLEALFLWSDLASFYQKLGYLSVGEECHFQFQAGHFNKRKKTTAQVSLARHELLSKSDLEKMLALRPQLPISLNRSVEEFRKLLQIPQLSLFIARENAEIISYAMLGKGYDMMGVIHEWGALDPSCLLDLIYSICSSYQTKQCLLLAPTRVDTKWIKILKESATACITQPMAWVKILNSQRSKDELDQLFIWGLDSI